MFTAFLREADKLLWHPAVADAPWPLRALLQPPRYAYALVRDAADGQLTLRAMSLVYTTLLSLVPLLAFSFSVLKGFGVHRQVEPVLLNFLQPLGAEKATELTELIIGFVDNIREEILGAVGLAVLIYTVISLVQKVEDSFNYVWQVDRPRSLARRFSEYLSVMLVGPLAMFIAIGLIASIASNALVQEISAIEPFGSTLIALGKLGPFILVVLVFSFVYGFVPNTRVRVLSALAGGITAGVLWASTGKLFASFVASSAKYTAIYSSFAIAVFALIWLYISWLILLLGAQIAFYHQNPRMLREGLGQLEVTNRARERLALVIMYLIGTEFVRGGPACDSRALESQLGVPRKMLGPVLSRLRARGLLLETEDERLLPARDLAGIGLDEVLAAVRGEDAVHPTLRSPAVDGVVQGLENAIQSSLAGRSLKDLIEQPPP